MPELQASRTLVKSAPELWEVCSDPDSLGRHLQAFGEIRITRVEPESTVAWEGERVSGTVRIEPSGWGTRVTLTALPEVKTEAKPVAAEPEPAVQSAAFVVPEPASTLTAPTPELLEPEVAVDPPSETPDPVQQGAPRRGRFRRLGGFLVRAFVTPVEISDEVFDGSPSAEELPGVTPESVMPEPVTPEAEPELEPEPVVAEPYPGPTPRADPVAVLRHALDSLGSDHHRPFSRT